jgi:hypothetical protein
MPRDEPLYRALRETIDNALKAIESLHRDLHALAIQQTKEAAEHSAVLAYLEKRVEKLEVGTDQVAAARIGAKAKVNAQLILTIGSVATAIGALVVALLK